MDQTKTQKLEMVPRQLLQPMGTQKNAKQSRSSRSRNAGNSHGKPMVLRLLQAHPNLTTGNSQNIRVLLRNFSQTRKKSRKQIPLPIHIRQNNRERIEKVKQLNIQERIKLAQKWLLHSGIQNKSGPHKGGFNAWYDPAKKQYPFIYSEITGYGISTLLYLNEIQPDPKLLAKAQTAANWLMNKAYIKNKSILCRFYYETQKFAPRLCTFDAGMCLKALVNLYRQTHKRTYLAFSKKIADWLTHEMQKEDGSLYARNLLDEERFQDNDAQWSAQSGSFHAKNAIGLLNLGFLTADQAYIESADKLCRWAQKMQQNDGRFVTNTKDGSTFLQPHCYSIEGILCAGVFLRKRKYIDSAVKGVKWIMNRQLPNGGFPAYYSQLTGKFSTNESADMSAQVIRLMLILSELKELKTDTSNTEKAVKRLFDFQYVNTEDPRAYGGFLAGPAWFENDYTHHVNSWITMFALQAAHMYVQKSQNQLKFNLFNLI